MAEDDEEATRAKGLAVQEELRALCVANRDAEARLSYGVAQAGLITPVTCGGCGREIAPDEEGELWLHLEPPTACLTARPAPREPDAQIQIRISPDPHPYVHRRFVDSSTAWRGEVLAINLGEDRAAVGGLIAVVQVPIQAARQWVENLAYLVNRELDKTEDY